MDHVPVLVFDTSAINRLSKEQHGARGPRCVLSYASVPTLSSGRDSAAHWSRRASAMHSRPLVTSNRSVCCKY